LPSAYPTRRGRPPSSITYSIAISASSPPSKAKLGMVSGWPGALTLLPSPL
jgi:hypothetical protein